MIKDQNEEKAKLKAGNVDLEADTDKVFSNYESLYAKMIDEERVALREASRDFLSKKEIDKALNAGVSFILTKGIDELVRFLNHKLKSKDVKSLIFVYQRLKQHSLDGLQALGEDLGVLIEHLRTDDYYSGKNVLAYWRLRRRRVEAYKKGVVKITESLDTLFDKMKIPKRLLEIETDDVENQLPGDLDALLAKNPVAFPESMAELFKIK